MATIYNVLNWSLLDTQFLHLSKVLRQISAALSFNLHFIVCLNTTIDILTQILLFCSLFYSIQGLINCFKIILLLFSVSICRCFAWMYGCALPVYLLSLEVKSVCEIPCNWNRVGHEIHMGTEKWTWVLYNNSKAKNC